MSGIAMWIDPDEQGFWRLKWTWASASAAGGIALLLFGLAEALRGSTLFLFLYGVNLLIHEAGHLIFGLTQIEFIGFIGGTLLQLLMPALFWIHFLRHDQPRSSDVCFLWLGHSLLSTGYYIADARSQALPLLIEGSEHDWAYILGELGLLRFDALLGHLTDLLGCAIVAIAIVSIVIRTRSAR